MTGNINTETESRLPPPKSSSPSLIEVEEEQPVKISSETREVECRFCQHINPIDIFSESKTVECALCTHETPIQKLKDGRIYVRCACGWLNTSKPSDFPILCVYCNNKKLQLKMGVNESQRNLKSYVCRYCNQRFEAEEDNKFWRCPMCNKKSSLGRSYATFRAVLCIFIGLLFLGGDAAFVVFTLDVARDHGGIYAGWAGFFIIGVGFLIGGLFYAQIRKSNSYKPLEEF